MPDLLLHSLATFEPLITDLLETTGARQVAEIGGEGGLFTKQLVEWADRVDGEVHCVDPSPSPQLDRLARSAERLRLLRVASPAAFEQLPPLDVCIIDGDHNYWTVTSELGALDGRLQDVERPALVVLHDVSWPCARRDSYYAPERIPAGALHEHSHNGGAVPGEAALQETGFSSAAQWAWARREGGPRNGVLSAVEDFLVERPVLELQMVPAVFGLGVLFASGAPWAERVRSLVAPYQHGLIARLESNRIELYLEVLRLQRELERRSRVHQLQLDRHPAVDGRERR
ncbi:MAG: class I SAM-dependent methyltransferase [Actinomycetota bacterium]|nr:class I SAM-dependent methyltransferase [Actinomycetota bacterium]